MSVTREHLDHLAKLAALQLTEEQYIKFGSQLDAIVDMVSKLESLDIDSDLVSSQIISHANNGLIQSDFDFFNNIRHPIAGHMPSVSFTTRVDN